MAGPVMNDKGRKKQKGATCTLLCTQDKTFGRSPRTRGKGQDLNSTHARIKRGQNIWQTFGALDQMQPATRFKTPRCCIDPVF